MESLNKSRYRYYKMYLAGLDGKAEIIVEGDRGRIRVETGHIPVTGISCGPGDPVAWLVRAGDGGGAAFLVGTLTGMMTGCGSAVQKNFYPFNVAGTGKRIEEFNEILVTVECGKSPAAPGKTVFFRQSVGCFTGQVLSNPLFYEMQPFDPPLQNYRWWGIDGNLCIAEHEAECQIKYRKEGGCQ